MKRLDDQKALGFATRKLPLEFNHLNKLIRIIHIFHHIRSTQPTKTVKAAERDAILGLRVKKLMDTMAEVLGFFASLFIGEIWVAEMIHTPQFAAEGFKGLALPSA